MSGRRFGWILLLAQTSAWALKTPVSTVVSNEAAVSEDVTKQIRSQIAQRFAKPESDFDVSVEQLSFSPPLNPHDKTVKVLSILGLGTQGSQRLDGLFVVDAMVKTAEGIQDRKISGLLKVIGPVVISKKNLQTGALVAENDIEEVRLPWKNFPAGGAYTAPTALRGKKVKTFVPAGGMLFANLVQDEESVRAGEWVNLTLVSSGGVMIRSKAISRQQGAIGDAIRVENPDTKKVLTGVVVGHEEVEVQL